ncbi:MAG TPA: hypothetical protein VNO70_05995 [Blastocatellia bacterium]|nr:hypothetical protein [Blastocatellia bacterium]
MKEYGELMTVLLHHREQFGSDEDFRRFLTESVRQFSRDLRDFKIHVAVSPEPLRPVARDWNYLKFGCE